MKARRIARSSAEMVVGMVAGMVLLAPLWPAGLTGDSAAVAPRALVMATNMSIGMAAVMLARRHDPRSTLTMCAAMYVPFLALLVPYSAGWLDAGAFFDLGHLLMLLLMLLLVHRETGAQPTDRVSARP
jgi:hypothetical protein